MTMRRTRCPMCKAKLEPGQRIHPACIEPFLADLRAKNERKAEKERKAKARVEKALDRKKRQELKTIPQLIKEAQVAFNAYIRSRDAVQGCISCGAPPPNLDGLHAGRDAGHYRSVGSASHLRFDERNCHSQCVRCNQHLSGNAVQYRIGLAARLTLVVVEALEADNTPHKWTREELIAIKAKYVEKLKELKRSRG